MSVDATHRFAKLLVGDETRVLHVGDWSDWVPLRFDVSPLQTLPAECRVLVKSLSPFFEMYVSPLNLDPLSPAETDLDAGRLRRRSWLRPRAGSTRRACPTIPRP